VRRAIRRHALLTTRQLEVILGQEQVFMTARPTVVKRCPPEVPRA